jgi:hypothetical protein
MTLQELIFLLEESPASMSSTASSSINSSSFAFVVLVEEGMEHRRGAKADFSAVSGSSSNGHIKVLEQEGKVVLDDDESK